MQTLTPEQRERVAGLLDQLLAENTQQELADALELSQTSISLIVRRKQSTSVHTARRICRLAGVDPATVLGVAKREPHLDARTRDASVLPAVKSARIMGESEGYDAEWVEEWVPAVAHPETLTAAQAWVLMQSDYICRANPRVTDHDVLDALKNRLGVAVDEVVRTFDLHADAAAKKNR